MRKSFYRYQEINKCMFFARNIFVCLLFLVPSTFIFSQTKRALVIGLGEQLDSSWGKINGDKDVLYILDMLNKTGYTNITTIVNSQATKEGIVSAFNSLVKESKAGDIIYIHFSGHGQRITDIDGDEDDGLDESWIPYDAYQKYCRKDHGEKHLIDDEVNLLLTNIYYKVGRKGKILVVVDACHSGDSALGVEETVRGVSSVFEIPSKRISHASKQKERWLTLCACRNFQFNQELKHPQVGILSYALYKMVDNGTIKMVDIENFIEQNKGPYPQTPVLTGAIDYYRISDFFTK